MKRVSIFTAAKVLGVSPDTLRRWEKAGKLKVERTLGGHRRYDLGDMSPPQVARRTLCYASALRDQCIEDQVRLVSRLCERRGWEYEVIRDRGSNLNYNKRGLRLLIHSICSGTVKRIVLAHERRLLRTGAELVFLLCDYFETEIVIVNYTEDIYEGE